MRAIILAAGMGTRLRPLTYTTPKSLVCVNGKPMLETQIEFLKEKGIDDIIVVTGYLHKKFAYLAKKYHVKLVHNDKYDKFNNIYTMYLVRDFLENSYVLDADIHLTRNIFIAKPTYSFYMSAKKPDFKNEWMFNVDSEGRVKSMDVGDGNDRYIMCGVSFWSKEDARLIVQKLEEAVAGGNFKTLYWDNIVKDNIHLFNVQLHPLKAADIFEIDSLDEWRAVETTLRKPTMTSFKEAYGLFSKFNHQELIENRHQNQAAQKAYDQRFGLVPVGCK